MCKNMIMKPVELVIKISQLSINVTWAYYKNNAILSLPWYFQIVQIICNKYYNNNLISRHQQPHWVSNLGW